MDLTAIVNAARRLPEGDLRAPGDRIAVGVRLLAALVESVGATPELARELRARPPGETLDVIVPAGSGQARIDLGQRQIAIPAALRDAVLSALERMAHSARPPDVPHVAAAPAASTVDPSATVKMIAASLQTAAAAAARSDEFTRALPRTSAGRARALEHAPHAAFDRPLLQTPADAASGAVRLRAAVERSGLFVESHLAAGDPRQLASVPAARTSAQLDVLAREALLLHGPAWPGQSATIELARERSADADAHRAEGDSDTGAFSARLSFDLPCLGPLQVRLRLSAAAVAVVVVGEDRALIERELPQLAAQFESRGLRPVALQSAQPR
jgi:hypothetical protein